MVLPVELRQFVNDEVAAGRFASDEEVVVAALQLLRSRTNWQLRQQVAEGLEDVQSGRVYHMADAAQSKAFFDELLDECEAEQRSAS